MMIIIKDNYENNARYNHFESTYRIPFPFSSLLLEVEVRRKCHPACYVCQAGYVCQGSQFIDHAKTE